MMMTTARVCCIFAAIYPALFCLISINVAHCIELCAFRETPCPPKSEQRGFDACFWKDLATGPIAPGPSSLQQPFFLATADNDAHHGRGMMATFERGPIGFNLDVNMTRNCTEGYTPLRAIAQADADGAHSLLRFCYTLLSVEEMKFKYPDLINYPTVGTRPAETFYRLIEFPIHVPDSIYQSSLFYGMGIDPATMANNHFPIRFQEYISFVHSGYNPFYLAPCEGSTPTTWWTPLWERINSTVDTSVANVTNTLQEELHDVEQHFDERSDALRAELRANVSALEQRVQAAIDQVAATESLSAELRESLEKASELSEELGRELKEMRAQFSSMQLLFEELRTEVALARSSEARIEELNELFSHMRVEIYFALIIGILAFILEVGSKCAHLVSKCHARLAKRREREKERAREERRSLLSGLESFDD